MDRRHPARLIRHAAQRTCRRSMRTATAALGTTMSRPSSLAGSHRVSLPISSQGAAKDCALSLTWSGRAAENAGLLKRQHRSRCQRRFPEDALVAKRRLSAHLGRCYEFRRKSLYHSTCRPSPSRDEGRRRGAVWAAHLTAKYFRNRRAVSEPALASSRASLALPGFSRIGSIGWRAAVPD